MENLRALVYGHDLSVYQKMLARREFEAIIQETTCCENPHNKMTRTAEDVFECKTCGKKHEI